MIIWIIVGAIVLAILSPFIWYIFCIIKAYAEMKVLNHFFKLNIDKYDEEEKE